MTHTLIPENANQNKVLQSRRENEKEKASERKLRVMIHRNTSFDTYIKI